MGEAADGDEAVAAATVTRRGISTSAGQRRTPTASPRHPGLDDLTEREREVLKLGARDRAQLVVIAHRNGLA